MSLRYWMKNDYKNQKDVKEGKIGSRFIDVDGVSEAIDVLRGAGLSEGADRLVCEGTLWLLRNQMKNGQFPVAFEGEEEENKGPFGEDPFGLKKDFYDRLHPTWVATQALRDRDYKIERRGNSQWKCWVTKVLKMTKFHELDYQPQWRCGLNPKGQDFR